MIASAARWLIARGYSRARAYLRGGSGGSNPPPPKFSDFFLKSEGKEIERKRIKRDVGGGGVTS